MLANPSFKILALSFLITIGVALGLEAFHKEVPKPYIYLPMAFATGVQLLQWRLAKNVTRKTGGVEIEARSVSEGPAGGGDPR